MVSSRQAFCILLAMGLGSCSFDTKLVCEVDDVCPTVTLLPQTPRTGDTVTATAGGVVSTDNLDVSYQFEWLRDGELVQSATDASQNTYAGELRKGETWTVRVTPTTDSGRMGPAVDAPFTVANSAPTVRTAGLSSYRPMADETVRAFVVDFEDADGDADATVFRWRVGTRLAQESISPLFDLASVSPPIDADTEQLTVDVVPADGETENDAATVNLGPFDVAPVQTTWRPVRPGLGLDGISQGHFVAFDPLHRRFLIYLQDRNRLWEYSEAGGFVELHPEGEPPSLPFMHPVYDGTVDAERLLVLHSSQVDPLNVVALEVADRGKERWTSIDTPPGPSASCGFAAFHDTRTNHLLLYGGLATVCVGAFADPLDELWVLDLSQPDTATWVGGGPLPVDLPPLWGATPAAHPTEEGKVYLFGGYESADPVTPADVRLIDFDLSGGVPRVLISQEAPPLNDSPYGVFSISDPVEGVIVGGLGASPANEAIKTVWTFDPETRRVQNEATGLLSGFDATLGATFGVGGRVGDELLVWPGRRITVDALDARFRLISLSSPDEGAREWASILEPGIDAPVVETQADAHGDTALVTNSTADSTLFRFGFSDHAWTRVQVAQPAPTTRTRLEGGSLEGDLGLWLVGGLGDPTPPMKPWRYEPGGWQALDTDASATEPSRRVSHSIFDTGCGDAPMGLFGGRSGPGALHDETWLLHCTDSSNACTWELVGGTSPTARAQSASVYDGRQYVLLFGGTDSMGFQDDLYVFDPCGSSELGWQVPQVDPDPVAGVAPGSFSRIVRINASGEPEFLLNNGDGSVWHLREVADKHYAWRRVQPAGSVAPLFGLWVWDSARARALMFRTQGEVWELRWRE